MFLVLLTYTVPESEIVHLRDAHYAFVDEHFKSGVFQLGGRRVPATGGFILAQGVGRHELAEIMSNDPYLVAGLVKHELIELTPTRCRPALADALGLELGG
ncbi:YciI family protein [Streptomyces sp. NPDC050528]|uniref:YciI family protein n=1 Tax=unclassified Streptomyces TaxID=2593676 RepID=UPI0037AC73AB